MGVRVELSTNKKENIKYPCLMINKSKNCIILMIDDGTGTILWDANPRWVGHFREKYWVMGCYEPFNGILSLSSEQ